MVRVLILPVLALGACVHDVEVVSDPPGATFAYGRRGEDGTRRQLIETPGVVQIASVPFARRRFEIWMPGYRPMEGDLRWAGIETLTEPAKVIGFRASRRIEVQLVPEHGPVGTWDPLLIGQ